jgi:hypothetical protein
MRKDIDLGLMGIDQLDRNLVEVEERLRKEFKKLLDDALKKMNDGK